MDTRSPDRPARLRADAVSLRHPHGPIVVHDVDLAVPDGRITVLIGPNGCGKSTLLAGLARLLTPASGTVTLDDAPIGSRPTREVARIIALLPQHPLAPEGATVRDLVGFGRTPHQGLLGQPSREDAAAVEAAMDAAGVTDLAQRPVTELSGGQRQRVWLAMVLAQDSDIVLLDEPTSFLDLGHAVALLDVVRRRNRERGTTVVMVLHDLTLAARYADHLVAMKDGRIVARGVPSEVLTAELAQELYELPCVVVSDPTTGAPVVLPR